MDNGEVVTAEFGRMLANLIREYKRFHADNLALQSILAASVKQGMVPVGWEALLEQERNTDAYRSISQEFASCSDDIERAADLHEAESLLRTIPQTRLPN